MLDRDYYHWYVNIGLVGESLVVEDTLGWLLDGHDQVILTTVCTVSGGRFLHHHRHHCVLVLLTSLPTVKMCIL